jgi:hypothetical protein
MVCGHLFRIVILSAGCQAWLSLLILNRNLHIEVIPGLSQKTAWRPQRRSVGPSVHASDGILSPKDREEAPSHCASCSVSFNVMSGEVSGPAGQTAERLC